MVRIVTELRYRPTITLEDGTEYNIYIPPKMRKYLVLGKDDGNKITLLEGDCRVMMYNCRPTPKAEKLLKHIRRLALKHDDWKTTITYVENYGICAKWEE